MSWNGISLGEMLDFYNGKAPMATPDGEYSIYGSNGIIGASKTFNNEHAVILGRVGAYCGSVEVCVQKFWASDNTIVVKPKEGFDLRFVYYLLKQSPLNSYAGGAAQPLLTQTILKGIKATAPPLILQKRIASTLSAYDSLIENNLRRMALLEESARLLYREWFVRLRFLGHEHTRIVNGVPEGWEKKPLADLCKSVDYGYTASAQTEEIGLKFLRITDIVPQVIDWSVVPYCEIPDGKKEKFLLQEGDIVIARIGATVGYAKRLHKRHPETIFASHLVRLRLKPEVDDLMIGIFVESEDYKKYVQSRIGGAAQPNANAKVLSGAVLLVPSPNLQKLFREAVLPIYDQRELLQIQNQKLKAARDLLLPKLMSGEIAV